MSLFLWYMDEALASQSQNSNPINEFSFFHYMGYQNRKYIRPSSPLYIREESGPLVHYNVYLENERWDIKPVEERMMQLAVG